MSAGISNQQAKGRTTLWIWRQIAIELPSEWECLQFARDPSVGRCGFADRHRYRLELNWRTFKSEPDFERMMKDYASSLENQWESVRTLRCRGWSGVTGRRGDEIVCRYGAYFAELELLVEVVFIHDQRRDDALEARVLNTVEPVLPNAEGWQRWRAFGIEVMVPEELKLAECVVEPARAGVRFDGPKKPDRWIFRRYGMVKNWLKIPLRDWLQAQLEESVRSPRPETVTQGNIHLERVTAEWHPKGILLPRGLYTTEAWIDPLDGRLYHAIYITGRAHRDWHPDLRTIRPFKACPEFTVVPS